jgi:hypothetical protein
MRKALVARARPGGEAPPFRLVSAAVIAAPRAALAVLI